MTQNSRKVTIWLSCVVSIHYGAENEHKLQAWIPKTQTLKVTQPWVEILRVSL